MLRRLCIVGASMALAFAAGCGDDDEDTGAASSGGEAVETTEAVAPETTAETTAATTETSSSGDGDIKVTIKDFAFDPAEVEGKVGQTVAWQNEDDAPHNAVAEGTDLKTPELAEAATATYELTEAGTIDYICTIHPQMKGKITVTE